MVQKIIKVGNSYAVTIPKAFIEEGNISAKSVVNVSQDLKNQKLTLQFMFKDKSNAEHILDKEVYKVGKNLLKRYLPAFKELAKR